MPVIALGDEQFVDTLLVNYIHIPVKKLPFATLHSLRRLAHCCSRAFQYRANSDVRVPTTHYRLITDNLVPPATRVRHISRDQTTRLQLRSSAHTPTHPHTSATMSFSSLVSDIAYRNPVRPDLRSQVSEARSYASTAATSVSISGDIKSQLHGGYSHPLARSWQAERQLTKVRLLLTLSSLSRH
jgi:hypothetical protein